MGNRNFSFAPGSFFHIYNRGNSKQKIFLDEYDYRRFISMLFVSNSTESFKMFYIKEPYSLERGELLVAIGAYCLMPNHFHLLLTPLVDHGVSLFMKKVMTGYAMYFNNKYNRTGSLFEGKFKAELADDDVYLKYLYSYIHLNPVKLIQSDWREVGIRDIESSKLHLRSYPHSSFMDYAGELREENKILNPQVFPNYFASVAHFENNIFEWFDLNKQVGPV